MFSILNEIKDNSPGSIVGVISASIGSAASIYVLVAITGYLTFGNSVNGNIISMCKHLPGHHPPELRADVFVDPPSVASTIGKAAIVILVTFSIPLQVHPCRASIDAVLKWRPNKYSRLPTSAPGRSSSPGGQPLMAPPNASVDNHGAPAAHISEIRFAIITTVILILSYATALTVSSLDRVLAYVGSTGSTSISFILPGVFYYKISDPEGIYHQRLTKEDDDAEVESEEDALEPPGASLVESATGLQSGVSGVLSRPRWRWMRRWRWDLEHLETGLLRKLALCLSIYGLIVMIVCLTMNLFVNTAEAHEAEAGVII